MSEVDDAVLSARLLLGWLAEPGSKALHEFTARYGPVEAAARLVAGSGPQQLVATAASRLREQDPARIVGRMHDQAERLGLNLIVPESPHWPAALDDLERVSQRSALREDRDTLPPQVLWLRGPLPPAEAFAECVAIVGARASSPYGDHVATEMAYRLAERGWTVISGGAFGIDAAAHRGALAADGATIAVMACGVDRPYPVGNSALLEQIAHRGLLISEWPPGAAPHRSRFLVRNRVIAAVARGVVIIEAAARSGSRQTLTRARQLGRRTMAVPGPVTSDMSVGCHEELRRTGVDAVRLVAKAEHVLEEVGSIGADLAPIERGPARAHDTLTVPEQRLVDGTPLGRGATAAQIAASAGVPVAYALAALPALELRGHIRRRADGSYTINP